jgi:glyoxylase I family protein
MDVEHVLAVVPVRDLAVATDWYTRLLGRAPDNNPMETLVEWQVVPGGWLQVFRPADPPAPCSVNLAVRDLDAAVGELSAAGFEPGEFLEASKGVRLSTLQDPDGNSVTLIGGFRVEY